MTTYEQSPLDQQAARAARDESLAAITDARKRDYEYVRSLALRLLRRYRRVTSDDVRGTMKQEGGSISHENVVGAVFNALAREGTTVLVGYQQSKAKKRKGGVIKVWSLASIAQKEG